MRWSYDERGSAIDLEITYREIRRRGWDGRRSDRIPPIWRPAVAKVLAEVEAKRAAAELQERFGGGAGRRRALQERLAQLQDERRRREAERRELD